MASPIEQAIRQIVEEKGLSYESVMETIEAALSAAFRKDFGHKLQNIEAQFNTEDGSVKVWDVKTVVEDQEVPELVEEPEVPEGRREPREVVEEVDADAEPKFNPKTEVMITVAQQKNPDAQIGDVIREPLEVPGEFGRMAAMTAKQVITQKLREAEREVLYNEYKDQEGEVLIGTVQRREGRVILVDIGRGTAVMRPDDQIPGERYNSGERIKVFLRSVDLGVRGPEILVSRTAPELVLELFKVEIPEIADGTVKIESIAREAGSRSKVAVSCEDEGVDPIGACIGQRGARIQTIIAELGNEKVDIIEFDTDPGVFVMNALAPAKVSGVTLDESEKMATVTVAADQLSLAIGRGGQNVRLAARLTDWRINVAEEGGEVKGSSEGAVRTPIAVVKPAVVEADAEGASEEVVDAEAVEEIEQATLTESLDELAEAADDNDDTADLEDESDDEAEEAQAGLEADELPTVEMEESDEAHEEITE
ncbi:transcription termination/antitermination protein NusA [Candidatus Uhrbacteria bacterium CG10_big_fil_rev_8_21_14_0_10_50_16]|uniref:Transcription termination/antitermination protein NusA n=1 Tax=Candidatus Uhrbacteria bacterium CG10_big_fil_rev_8_21_14_0_10_50_16 TaxID=1975039 RepID=A0A2H0RL41_9BACT|nr:MAG: transcription termination/antitermination protein NusA [Candidatus Uhrbacteria bacterium CG10_big_fil_rev_8_21_14_0_10_50_16]